MPSLLLILCIGITFFLSVILNRWWIKRARKAGLTGKDMHKPDKREVAEVGGLSTFAAFLLGILLYLGIRTFLFKTTNNNLEILAGVLAVTFIALIGLVDDILGWKIGLRQWQKPIFCLFAALPVMMINAGNSTMDLPFFGTTNIGILYALIVIPVTISASANAFNMIAGYNGLEAGMGIIMLFGIGFIVWIVQGQGIYAMLGAVMIAALLGFLIFNHYPAKLFPGDTMTYSVGALIAVIAILGNAEKALLVLFLPYILQFFIKARHGWRKEGFSEIGTNGEISNPSKINAIEHLVTRILYYLKKRVYEVDVVYSLLMIEVLLVTITLLSIL